MELNALTSLSDAMVRAVETAGNSTVRVDARKGLSSSGVVYQPGLVIAASHAVEREEDIQVQLPGGVVMRASLVGRDPSTDLCLLRLGGDVALAATPAPEEAQVGQIVMSLGRPTDEGIQASLGVVGMVGGPLTIGRGSIIERFIRTDAIPYPGFSGGPLVDGDGKVLGINTSGFAPGASLAIPAATTWRVAEAISQHGRVRRGFLGIRSQAVELPPEASQWMGRSQVTGLLLVGVERGQPADRAGLMVGDILIALDNQPVETHDSLILLLSNYGAGQVVQGDVLRGGQLITLPIRIGERE